MKFIKEYKKYVPNFEVGDVVYIRYWYLKEEDCPNELRKRLQHTPVILKSSNGRGKFLVNFDVEGSLLKGAPEMEVSKSEIIDHVR